MLSSAVVKRQTANGKFSIFIFPIVHCLLPIAYCLLSIAYCQSSQLFKKKNPALVGGGSLYIVFLNSLYTTFTSMNCRNNNHHHNNYCGNLSDDHIDSAIQHEVIV